MLIDAFLPAYHVTERHSTVVKVPAEQVYAALRRADLADCRVVRLLLALRVLPAALTGGVRGWAKLRKRMSESIRLREFEEEGFAVLAETPPKELLIGLVGTLWTLRSGMRAVDARSFKESQPAGTARAAWNFAIEPAATGGCRLSTETRVQCADPASRRRFRMYWLLIRPASGLIRRCMLRAIKREAERDPGSGVTDGKRE